MAEKSQFFVVKRGSTALQNKVILSGLSYQALGLLVTALSLRPGTPLGYRNLAGRGLGQTATRKALQELEEAGFRHRFLVRNSTGLKTIVVMTDESMPPCDVLEEIQLPPNETIIKTQSREAPQLPKFQQKTVEGNGRQITRSTCASNANAQDDQRKRKITKSAQEVPVADQHEQGISAGGRVLRSSGAHPSAAHPIEAGRSPNTLRVKNSTSPLTPTDKSGENPLHVSRVAAPLGGSPDGDPGGEIAFHEKDSGMLHSSEAIPQADLSPVPLVEGVDVMTCMEEVPEGALDADLTTADLLGRVLPKPMRSIPPRHAHRVASMIRDRLDAGWTIETLHAALEARALPSEVRNLSALVIARFRDDIPADGAPPEQSVVPTPRELVRADGSPVKHYDLDWGLIAMDHKQALSAGTTSATTRRQFVLDAGVERYLLGA